MKKSITKFTKFGLLVISVLLAFGSCDKEDKYYSDTDIYTKDFEVKSNDWNWETGDDSYFYQFNYDEIRSQVVNNGTVQVAAFIDGAYRPLPYTTYFTDQNGTEYAETINFEYNTGYIRFNVIALDLFGNSDLKYKPDSQIFRVTVISYM